MTHTTVENIHLSLVSNSKPLRVVLWGFRCINILLNLTQPHSQGLSSSCAREREERREPGSEVELDRSFHLGSCALFSDQHLSSPYNVTV